MMAKNELVVGVVEMLSLLAIIYVWSLFLPLVFSAAKFELIAVVSFALGIFSYVYARVQILKLFGLGRK